jgi:hypothetical protein
MTRFSGAYQTLRVIPVLLLAACNCWGRQAEPVQQHQREFINYVQQMSVSRLDPALPEVRLVRWLSIEAGAESKIAWDVTDCRDVERMSVDAHHTFPLCVEVTADMKDGRSILLVVAVESSKPTSDAKAELCFGQLVTSHETIGLHHLSDLPVALIRTHGTVGYPEIAK